MECEYQIKGTTLRIFLPQELDHHVSARLREEADLMVETHFIRTIIFDFPALTGWTVPVSVLFLGGIKT